MSKPHPTESDEIYCTQVAGIIAATKCAALCARRLFAVVVDCSILVFLTFLFSTAT